MVEQPLQRGRLDPARPAQERGVVRRAFEPQPTELPQHQAIIDELLGLGVAPPVQPAHDQQPQEHFDRRRGPPSLQGVRAAAPQIGLDGLEQRIVLQQPVQLGQDRLKLQRQRRRQRERVDGRVAIA